MANELTSEEELYQNLHDDPEEAFLKLERHFRATCEAQVQRAGENGSVDVYYTTYMSKVLAALSELGLDSKLATGKVPSIKDVGYHTYAEFTKDVEHYKTQLNIRRARRIKSFSVHLDAAAKQKIRHYLEQIRQVIEASEAEPARKDALFSKINALQEELDRERTRYEAYGDLVIEAAGALDDTIGKLGKMQNIKDLIENIGKVLWGAKKDEAPKLPSPPKKLMGPSTKIEDEIPF